MQPASIILTRKEYNRLVTIFTGYMQTEWPKLNTHWHIGGVTVCFRTWAEQDKLQSKLEEIGIDYQKAVIK